MFTEFNELKKFITKVYKTGPNTQEAYKKETYNDDSVSNITIESTWDWRPFQSETYWLAQYPHKSMYLSSNYYPIGPSGKFNINYGGRYMKCLRNLEEVGTYDGQDLSFDIPYLYTSLYEVKPLEVFTFDDLNIENTLFTENKKYVLESFDNYSNGINISEFENPSKIFRIRSDVKVNIIGKMINTRIFEPSK